MLSIEDVQVFYGNIRALEGVSLHVKQGEIVTLIGANGAGKSTLLKTVSGLLKPKKGRVLLEGKEIGGKAAQLIVKKGISHVPEGRRVFANMTVEENLQLGAYLRKDKEGLKQDYEKVYSLFPRLLERLKQQAGTLSGGEQQMLAMGRALMAKPRLLLLDEPSMGLAPLLVKTIFRIIEEINQAGTTILLVEQNAHLALSIAQRAYVMETGRIVLSGTSDELTSSDQVKMAYLGGH
ncbi:branched-chain amino acid ABC transporter ATP-binding protein [Fictibacillus macauensis ZFHKF-1]|uniref:Branched-chain amino acid ABC transporter ATP-binding protein n=1 Tax=Fictibacillus macauensis ZFHKF-1 TaxID=1196324 RepID=I8UD68_9BACL|nr:ABC transporter ATP-binding protein [Fictibacillus macauensis]EIT84753.1 branched-chain amino acid ABC transporter ATP-binding protein [Fictibacillus macauensis ZFHKF-1]